MRFGIILLVTALISNCILLNELHVSPIHVTGAEAKKIIRDKLKNNLFFSLLIDQNSNANSAAKPVLDSSTMIIFNAPDMLGLKDARFYKKRDVESCADKLSKFAYRDYLLISHELCTLEEADPVIDL